MSLNINNHFQEKISAVINSLVINQAAALPETEGAALFEQGQQLQDSIALFYAQENEYRSLSIHEGMHMESDTSQLLHNRFEAMTHVISLARSSFPHLFVDIPQRLEDPFFFNQVFERPMIHMCRGERYVLSESLVDMQGTCPISGEEMGSERNYDYELQEEIYNLVLTRLGNQVNSGYDAPAALSAPIPHGHASSSSPSFICASPAALFAQANQYDPIYRQLHTSQDHLTSACTAIVGYAASEILSIPPGAPVDLGKILWEGHKVMADEIKKNPYEIGAQLAFGDIIGRFDQIQIPAIGAIPDAFELEENGIPYFAAQIEPHFYHNLLNYLSSSTQERGLNHIAVAMTLGGGTYLLDLYHAENGTYVRFFDSHGSGGSPASLVTFSSIIEASHFLETRFPPLPYDEGTQEGANLINLYPLVLRQMESAAPPSFSDVSHQSAPSSSIPSMDLSGDEAEVTAIVKTTIGNLYHCLSHKSADPHFAVVAHLAYSALQKHRNAHIVNRVYAEYSTILTTELGWVPDGQANWAEHCFQAQSFDAPGVPSVQHMAYLRVKAMENALFNS